MAPSTLGTFLRSFSFGQVRQLDRVLAESVERAWSVELGIRDLKDDALAHYPSGSFAANCAWMVIACLAHNLQRSTGQLGLKDPTSRTARTIRGRLLALPAG
jgi:hypothetical protein